MLRGHYDARTDRRTVDVRSVRRPTEPDVTARRRSQTGRDRSPEGSGRGRKCTTLAIHPGNPEEISSRSLTAEYEVQGAAAADVSSRRSVTAD